MTSLRLAVVRASENPVFSREVRSRIRSPATTVALMAYLASVAGVAAILFSRASVGSPDQAPGAGQLERVAYHAMTFQIVLVVFSASALGAGAISGERRRGTYDELVAGTLSSRSIVAAKLAASMAYVLLFMVAAAALVRSDLPARRARDRPACGSRSR